MSRTKFGATVKRVSKHETRAEARIVSCAYHEDTVILLKKHAKARKMNLSELLRKIAGDYLEGQNGKNSIGSH